MKKITAILLLIASILCLSSCHLGDIEVALYAPYWNFWNYSKGSSFTYSAADIKKVDITWVGGEIEVVASEADELSVSENSEGLADDAKMHYYIKGEKLTIHYSKALYREEVDTAQKHLRVEIPEGIELDIDNVNSDIKIGNMELGEMKLTNVSGNVTLASLVCNEVKIENVDGTVYADEILADKFSADSVAGSLDVSKIISNKIAVKTVSGNTSLNIAKKSEVKISGVSGEVKLAIDEEAGATIEYSTMSGSFNSEKPHTTNKKTHIFGGGEIQIDVETVSGNLHIF
jgi:DUF4097 and DUF4098 domain-containing protein YvlB